MAQIDANGLERLRVDGDNDDWGLDANVEQHSRCFRIGFDHVLLRGLGCGSTGICDRSLSGLEVVQKALQTYRAIQWKASSEKRRR